MTARCSKTLTTHVHEDLLTEDMIQQDVEMMKQMTVKTNKINIEQRFPHMEGTLVQLLNEASTSFTWECVVSI